MSKRMKELAKRVANIVDMTVEDRRALIRVARAAKALDVANYPQEDWVSGSMEFQSRKGELRQAIKEVEHLL